MKKALACIGALFIYLSSSAQCFLKEVDFNERTTKADVIVEGKVTSKSSFWNEDHTMIYTGNIIEVYKVLKGHLSTNEIEILTVGGMVDDKMITTNSLLSLDLDETGIFFCETVKRFNSLPAAATGVTRFETYGSKQGFIKYDLVNHSASDPFKKYGDVISELYQKISPSMKFEEKKAFNINSAFTTLSGPTPTALTSFSPATITAGTGSVLTITGTGFGATRGTGEVRFPNADDGGASRIAPLASQYLSWTDTQIQVEVPQNAGTGTIQVVQGVTQTSASALTISYAHLNVNFDPGSGTIAYQTDHINDNGSGGYTWRMNTAFDANAAARASFVRAFDTWRCGTNVNWVIGATTALNSVASDGINIICFDNTAPLSAGVLGVCTSYWSGCASGPTIVWYVNELDIIFDEGSNITPLTWEYGTATPAINEYDFETVAVHELGHGHQLGHVISPGAIMHYALSNGSSNRSLSANDLAGGNFVQAKSVVANVCGPGAMSAYTSCTLPIGIIGVKAFQKENGIQLEWANESETEVNHYEVEESDNGTAFKTATSVVPTSNNGMHTDYQWFDRQINNEVNYYRIKSVGINEMVEYSSIVRVRSGQNNPSVQLYPNPLKGNNLAVELTNMKSGTYFLTLYNISGQQVFTKTVVHLGGNATQAIQLPGGMAAGIHRLVLKGNDVTLQQTLLIKN